MCYAFGIMIDESIIIASGVAIAAMFFAYQYFTGQQRKAAKAPVRGKVLSSFATNLTDKARAGKIDPFVGREDEIERAIHILMRRTKNNPLLIGEPGVGKTAVVEGIALRMINGDIPEKLKDKEIYALDLNALVADTKYRGDLEKRLHSLMQELDGIADQLILFIDEIHLVKQMSGAEGALNMSDVLKPALARGELRIIGATTWQEYQKYIKPDQALERRLQPVLIDEPTTTQAVAILKTLRPVYEKFHGVKITDEALKAAVDISKKKIKNRQLPDKAIDLMDEAAAKVSIELHHCHKTAVGLVHAAAQACDETVDAADIEQVAEPWITHVNRQP